MDQCSMASTEASSRSRRLRVAAALTAAACAVGLTAVVVRQDVSSIGSALAQYTSYGPGGAVSAESPVHWQQLQAAQRTSFAPQQPAQHELLAHMCFGEDCADVPPAFAKALISSEKGAYAKAFHAGEAAVRHEMTAAKPHQVGDIINGVQPMRVATMRDEVEKHERLVAAGPPKPAWHSQWEEIFGHKQQQPFGGM